MSQWLPTTTLAGIGQPPRSPVLACQQLVRDLGDTVKTRALAAVTFNVYEGEFVSLTGLSGSGKSTLLYLLGALDRPTSGQVLIDGIDIGQLDDDMRADLRSQKLGFVFQFHFLLPEFTVLENVMLPMQRRGARTFKSARERAESVLHQMDLGGLMGRRPYQLSGGQQQRVSIARAVANDPRLILADEPTGNLDTQNAEIVMSLFERMVAEEHVTVIMVTHERSFAHRATRQIVLRDGAIVEDHDQRRRLSR